MGVPAAADRFSQGLSLLLAGKKLLITGVRTSTFSLKELACAVTPLMGAGGSIGSLTFDNRFAWPVYDWMGVCKSGLESVARYLARDLGPRGIRVNTVAAGPLATIAAKAIHGFSEIKEAWQKAPLGWDTGDPEPVARMVAVLLSDWAPARIPACTCSSTTRPR